MAAVEIQGTSMTLVMNGAFTFVEPVRLPRTRDGKKRAADENLLLADESEARGWSSAVPDRTLALRRRRGQASSSCRHLCIVVTEAPDSHCRAEEAVPQVVVGTEMAVQEPERKASSVEEMASVEELVYWTIL